MNTRSILTIGIILVCLFYVLGDSYTIFTYYEAMQISDESFSGFGITPLEFYSFLILFILKVTLLFKASTVATYLLPKEQDIIPSLQMANVLVIIGIVVCITTIPNLIMSIAEFKTQAKYIDDPYKAFNAKIAIYQNALELILALAVMYWRNDLLKLLARDKKI